MSVARAVEDEQLDEMDDIISQFREYAHQVAHARHLGDIDAVHAGLAAMEALYTSTDAELLAAALLEKLFAADWEACQSSLSLPHLLP